MININNNQDLISDILNECTKTKALCSGAIVEDINAAYLDNLLSKAYIVFIDTMQYKSTEINTQKLIKKYKGDINSFDKYIEEKKIILDKMYSLLMKSYQEKGIEDNNIQDMLNNIITSHEYRIFELNNTQEIVKEYIDNSVINTPLREINFNSGEVCKFVLDCFTNNLFNFISEQMNNGIDFYNLSSRFNELFTDKYFNFLEKFNLNFSNKSIHTFISKIDGKEYPIYINKNLLDILMDDCIITVSHELYEKLASANIKLNNHEIELIDGLIINAFSQYKTWIISNILDNYDIDFYHDFSYNIRDVNNMSNSHTGYFSNLNNYKGSMTICDESIINYIYLKECIINEGNLDNIALREILLDVSKNFAFLKYKTGILDDLSYEDLSGLLNINLDKIHNIDHVLNNDDIINNHDLFISNNVNNSLVTISTTNKSKSNKTVFSNLTQNSSITDNSRNNLELDDPLPNLDLDQVENDDIVLDANFNPDDLGDQNLIDDNWFDNLDNNLNFNNHLEDINNIDMFVTGLGDEEGFFDVSVNSSSSDGSNNESDS